jgi:hypothetical protein
MTASPNTGNYYVGKGVVKWKGVNDAGYRDLGNCPMFELTPTVTKLMHYSSRAGRKFKDKQVTQQVELMVKMTLDEITPDNLRLALMGTEADSTGLVSNILDQPDIIGALRFIGTNDVGDKQQVDLPTVLLTPTGAISFIADGWAVLSLDGDVTADALGNFGVVHSGISAEIP